MYQTELKNLNEGIRLASQLCLNVRDEMVSDPSAMEKVGKEPVTIADYGSQAIILKFLSEAFPDDGVIAEESAEDFLRLASEEHQMKVAQHISQVLGETVTVNDIARWLDFGHGRSTERVWTVDPIDGTKGFIRREQFAIAVALMIKGELTVAGLGCPMMSVHSDQPEGAHGIIAFAVKGEGAILQSLDGTVNRPMKAASTRSTKSARLVESVETGHTSHSFSERVMEMAGVSGQSVRMDSQAKYVAVADGRAEIYLRNSKDGYIEKIWDHGAGALVIAEAGGKVTDLNGLPLDFSRGKLLDQNRGILATNSYLHDHLLSAIKEAS